MPRILTALLLAAVLSGSALAQTAPKTKSLGAEPPKTALYVAFHEYARKHSETVVKHGARPVLFMTPQVNLYDPDKRHPSLAGSYLAACTILATVYGKSPVGNSHVAGLDPKVAAFLQQIADETVKEYLGRGV